MDFRFEKYKNSPETIQELYGSIETAHIIGNISKKIGLANESTHDTFVDLIGDTILGIRPKHDLRQSFRTDLGLTDEQISAVLVDLEPVLKLLPGTTEPIVNQIADTPTTAPATTVKPLRTFAEDVEISRAHGYGAFRSPSNTGDSQEPIHRSSQDDIIGQ